MKIPLKYVLAFFYLAEIPGFGIVYSHIPHGFYESSIKLENAFNGQSQQLASKLCFLTKKDLLQSIEYPTGLIRLSEESKYFSEREINDVIANDPRFKLKKRPYIQDVPPDDFSNIVVVPNSIWCSDGLMSTSDADTYSFKFRFRYNITPTFQRLHQPSEFIETATGTILFTQDEPLAPTWGHQPTTAFVEFNTNQSNVIYLSDGDPLDTPSPKWLPSANILDRIFQGAFFKIPQPPLEPQPILSPNWANNVDRNDNLELWEVDGSVGISNDLNEELSRFLSASSGFTSDANDNLGRMIYFSMITITTTGYGDIVPVTPLARDLVATEIITGVLLIGLFLNAVNTKNKT